MPPGNLQQLVELARETSSEKRRELLREVTDVFVGQPDEFSDTELDYFSDVIGQLSAEMSADVRAQLSSELSMVDETPQELARRFAMDEEEIASPMLRHSKALTEDDLLEIAQTKGQGHLEAIAGRDSVSERLSDTIVARGEDKVLVTLAKNQGAKLSRSAMETLVDKSQDVEELQEHVATRADMPLDLLNEMYFFVSQKLRAHILKTNADINEAELDAILEASAQKRLRSDTLRKRTKVEQFIDRLHHAGDLNEKVLHNFAKHRQINELIIGFARLAELDNQTARHVLFDPTCEALTIACRAMDFSRAGFNAILKVVGGEDGSLSKDAQDALAAYNDITLPVAQRTMRFWRIRRSAMADDAA